VVGYSSRFPSRCPVRGGWVWERSGVRGRWVWAGIPGSLLRGDPGSRSANRDGSLLLASAGGHRQVSCFALSVSGHHESPGRVGDAGGKLSDRRVENKLRSLRSSLKLTLVSIYPDAFPWLTARSPAASPGRGPCRGWPAPRRAASERKQIASHRRGRHGVSSNFVPFYSLFMQRGVKPKKVVLF